MDNRQVLSFFSSFDILFSPGNFKMQYFSVVTTADYLNQNILDLNLSYTVISTEYALIMSSLCRFQLVLSEVATYLNF